MSDGKSKPPLRASAVPPRASAVPPRASASPPRASASPPRPAGLAPRPSASARPNAISARPASGGALGSVAQRPAPKSAPPLPAPASEPTMHTVTEPHEDDGGATIEALTVHASVPAVTVDDGVEALDEGLEDLSADAVSENSREVASVVDSAEYATSDDLDNAPTHHLSKPLPASESGTMPLQNLPLSQRAPNLFMPSATPPPQRVQKHPSLPPNFRPIVESADSFEPPPRPVSHHDALEWRPGEEGPAPPPVARAESGRPRARSFEEGQFTGTPHELPQGRGKSLPSFSEVTHDPFAPTGIRRRLPLMVAGGLLLLIAVAAIAFLRS